MVSEGLKWLFHKYFSDKLNKIKFMLKTYKTYDGYFLLN